MVTSTLLQPRTPVPSPSSHRSVAGGAESATGACGAHADGHGILAMHDKRNKGTEPVTSQGLRHARMKIETAVLMSRGGDAFSSEVADISSTGVLVQRPQGWKGNPDELWVLDMLVGEDLNIHVEATVARVTAHHVGLAYARIPDDKQEALWNLLGGYADTLEPWDDE